MKPIVSIQNLGKKYTIKRNKGVAAYTTLRDTLAALPRKLFSKQPTHATQEEFWALKGVNLDIMRGERVGIIGRNGAGKSTLLKLLSRITEPTTGSISLRGRVASLLEVGTGFHPELTGRENIFLNGAILGMSQTEIRQKFDAIVDFSGVEKFLDTPVKRYSSGMYVRLAFAVAAHLEPEVLIVDEVLAVGDLAFQKKCLGKMEEVSKGGDRTVLFVSHNMGAIKQLCNRVICFDQGELTLDSTDTHKAIQAYYSTTVAQDTASCWVNADEKFKNPYFYPHKMECAVDKMVPFSDITITITGYIETIDPALQVGISVYTLSNELLFWACHNDGSNEQWPKPQTGKSTFSCTIPYYFLNTGKYRVDLLLAMYRKEWICEPGNNAPSLFFTVDEFCSHSPYWNVTRPGLLAPVFKWSVAKG